MVLLLISVVTLIAGSASAQVPTIGVYFDKELTNTSINCMGIGLIDTVYVGASSFNTLVSTMEFRIQFGGINMNPMNEIVVGAGLKLGTSFGPGATITWPTPRNGFTPFIVEKITVMWQCDNCGGLVPTEPTSWSRVKAMYK
jgi:hypothetical protein